MARQDTSDNKKESGCEEGERDDCKRGKTLGKMCGRVDMERRDNDQVGHILGSITQKN